MGLPTLLAENRVSAFSYYWDGKVRSGMTVQGRLYALLVCFPEDKRTVAYEKGCHLSQHYDDVVITASEGTHPHYCLWIPLSSRTDPALLSRAVHFRHRWTSTTNDAAFSHLPAATSLV